jgi:hypothetical protein
MRLITYACRYARCHRADLAQHVVQHRSARPMPTPSAAINAEVINLTSPPLPPSAVDADPIINKIMEAHHKEIMYHEETLDSTVSHYKDENRKW